MHPGPVRELAAHCWQVTRAARGEQRTPLHDLADADGRVTVDRVDSTVPDELVALRERPADRSWDLLLVGAGVAGGTATPSGRSPTAPRGACTPAGCRPSSAAPVHRGGPGLQVRDHEDAVVPW